MKRTSLILIIAWCVIGSAILGLLVSGLIWGGIAGQGRVSSRQTELLAEEKARIEGIDAIDIDLVSEECVVFLTDESEIAIKHYGKNLPKDRIAGITSSGGVLTVSTHGNHSGFKFFNFGFNEYSRIEIYLPKAFKNRLIVDMASGALEFTDALDLSELSVDIMSGTVRSDSEIKADKTSISLASGRIRLTGGLITQDYSMSVTSGSVNVDEKITGSGTIDVASGTVRLSGVDIAESLNIEVLSGTVDVEVSGDPDLKFSGEKLSGTISTYFDLNKNDGHYTALVGNEPYKNLTVDIASGKVRITNS